MFSPIDSDKLQGVIRNPFAFYFPIKRGFSGPIQTLPSALSQSVVAEDKNYSSTKDIQLSDHSE